MFKALSKYLQCCEEESWKALLIFATKKVSDYFPGSTSWTFGSTRIALSPGSSLFLLYAHHLDLVSGILGFRHLNELHGYI